MNELLKVTAVTVNGAIVKVEDAHVISETNGIYEVLVSDGTYHAVATPKMGNTVVTLTGSPTKEADANIEPITKSLKIHADDLPKSEAKAFIAKLGHTKLVDAVLSEKELMAAMANQVINDDELMKDAVDAAMEAMPEGSNETRESVHAKIVEAAMAEVEEFEVVEEVDPFTAAFTAAFKK